MKINIFCRICTAPEKNPGIDVAILHFLPLTAGRNCCILYGEKVYKNNRK